MSMAQILVWRGSLACVILQRFMLERICSNHYVPSLCCVSRSWYWTKPQQRSTQRQIASFRRPFIACLAAAPPSSLPTVSTRWWAVTGSWSWTTVRCVQTHRDSVCIWAHSVAARLELVFERAAFKVLHLRRCSSAQAPMRAVNWGRKRSSVSVPVSLSLTVSEPPLC